MAHGAIPNLTPDNSPSIFHSHSRPVPHTDDLTFPKHTICYHTIKPKLTLFPPIWKALPTCYLLYPFIRCSNPSVSSPSALTFTPPISSENLFLIPSSATKNSVIHVPMCLLDSHESRNHSDPVRAPILLTSPLRPWVPWELCHVHSAPLEYGMCLK